LSRVGLSIYPYWTFLEK